MKQAWLYSFKVWITAVLVSPFGVLLYFYSINDAILVNPVGYILITIYGMVFSVPSLLLLWLITHQLIRRSISVVLCKSILTFVGVVLTITATSLLLSVSYDLMALSANASYALVIVFGIWIYQLKPAQQQIPNAVD